LWRRPRPKLGRGAKERKKRTISLVPQYVSMAWYSVKHRDKFAFFIFPHTCYKYAAVA
jgi:hypothetical protein